MTEQKAEYQTGKGGYVTSAPQQAMAELSGYYAMIPAELIKKGNANAMLLYAALDRVAGKPDCFATLQRLADDTGLSVRAVQYARDQLLDQGFLEIINRGTGHRATDYHLPFRSLRHRTPGMHPMYPRDARDAPDVTQGSTPTYPRDAENDITRSYRRESLKEEPSILESKSKISQNSQNQDPPRRTENDDDQTLWPKWYANGYAVPGWRVSLERAEAWRVEANIPEALAEVKSYALRDWWERLPEDSARRKKGNPWLTFQNWCREARDQWITINGGGDGKPGVDTQEAGEDEWEREARRMREHRKAIRAEHGLPPEPDLVPNMPGIGVGLPPGPVGAP